MKDFGWTGGSLSCGHRLETNSELQSGPVMAIIRCRHLALANGFSILV